MKIDFLILDGPPQSFGKNVVQGSSFSIHANVHISGLQQSEILRTCEMAPLITVTDQWNSLTLMRACTADTRQKAFPSV